MANILIVDDHFDTCDTLRRLFQRYGWCAACTTDARSAPDQLHQLQPDVVLLDVMMPEVDGFGVLAAIRADPRIADTPVVMYSALSDEKTKTRARAAGANDYVTKGTPFASIEERVASQIN
jgi:PleD family two-component response regulator